MKRVQKAYIQVTIVFNEEDDGRWTARCLELGTATFGSDLDEVVEAMEEAIGLQLNTLEDLGECFNFLKENKVKIYDSSPSPAITDVDVKDIPLGSFVHPEVHEIYCVPA